MFASRGGARVVLVDVLTSLALATVAIVRDKERSPVLLVVAGLTLLLVVSVAVGESLGDH